MRLIVSCLASALFACGSSTPSPSTVTTAPATEDDSRDEGVAVESAADICTALNDAASRWESGGNDRSALIFTRGVMRSPAATCMAGLPTGYAPLCEAFECDDEFNECQEGDFRYSFERGRAGVVLVAVTDTREATSTTSRDDACNLFVAVRDEAVSIGAQYHWHVNGREETFAGADATERGRADLREIDTVWLECGELHCEWNYAATETELRGKLLFERAEGGLVLAARSTSPCVSGAPVQCASDEDCPEGEVCGGELCHRPVSGGDAALMEDCSSTSDCPNGMRCVQDICAFTCDTDGDCTNGSCSEGVCEPCAE